MINFIHYIIMAIPVFLAGFYVGTSFGHARSTDMIKKLVKRSSKKHLDKINMLETQTNNLLENCLIIIAKYEKILQEAHKKTPYPNINREN